MIPTITAVTQEPQPIWACLSRSYGAQFCLGHFFDQHAESMARWCAQFMGAIQGQVKAKAPGAVRCALQRVVCFEGR